MCSYEHAFMVECTARALAAGPRARFARPTRRLLILASLRLRVRASVWSFHDCERVRYFIQQKVGRGGMADVFTAVARGPEDFERPLVVKRIRPELASSPMFVKLFIDEATLSARLTHPNIVHVYDFGAMEGGYFLAMEQVMGRDLRWMLNHLRQRSVVPVPAVAAEIARQCCLALEYAHGLQAADGTPLNIVHRDVTPGNIMVACDGTVKLLDFGVAHTMDPTRRSQTDAGVVKGKLAYLAPEQVQSQAVDLRCDLFSLGVVLYELLTWRHLFHAKNDVETLKQVLALPIAPPSSRNRGISVVLDRIVLKALDRDPGHRYQSAGDMADDLERYLISTRHSGRVMRRLMREVFGRVWRESEPPDEPDTLLNPPGEDPSEATIDAESCIVEVVQPDEAPVTAAQSASSASSPPRHERRWRKALMAAGGFGAALFLGGAVAMHGAPATTVALPGAPTVSVSIDSVPQGALIFRDSVGPPIGETPLVLTLPRSQEVAAYALVKDGFEAAAIKIIPDQDKPVLVLLRAAAVPLVRGERSASRARARGRAATSSVASVLVPECSTVEPEWSPDVRASSW
jgi:serine/threonine-protein kinase